MALSDITITSKMEIRDCTVNGEPGYFHCWEHYSKPVPESLLRGGAPAGVVSFIRALVEFPEGMRYVYPEDIQFCDEKHASLCALAKHMKETTNGKHDELKRGNT